MPPVYPHIRSLIRSALQEDYAARDITTQILFPALVRAKATITVKEDLIIAGLDIAKQVFLEVDRSLKFRKLQKDGTLLNVGTPCCTIQGDARSILNAERVALNFLQHLSGIASMTHQFCLAANGTHTKILDTRKTTPGLRLLEKWAVTQGGGTNHRSSLKDGILIKDNHLALLQSQGISLDQACQIAKKHAPRKLKVCVEAETLNQVQAAIKGQADVILLDNMSPQTIKKAIRLINERAFTEISGGITMKNVRAMARLGADFISIGALTHSARAVDLSMSISPIRTAR